MKLKDIIKINIYNIFLRPANYLLSSLLIHFQTYNNKILVYSAMPPATTGMASFALRIFKQNINDFIIINKFNHVLEYFYALFFEKNFNKNIFDISANISVLKNFTIKGKIFVIGNSPHHDETFKKAVETKGEANRFLYIGENLLLTPPLNYLNGWRKEKMEQIIEKYYNKKLEITFEEDLNTFWVKNNIYGLKIIKELTGINKFIVFNDYSRKLFEKEFSEDELKELEIYVINPPIDEIKDVKISKELIKSNEYLIGSFGLPQAQKSTHDIIEAVNLLNKSGEKIKLILAGYSVKKYLGTLNLDKNNIIIYEKPSTKKLLSLMKTVDIAIQLRPNSQGETSGCVSELLGLNKIIISTAGFVTNGLDKFCINVPPYISPEALAKVILESLNANNCITRNIFENYTFKNAANMIKEILWKYKAEDFK